MAILENPCRRQTIEQFLVDGLSDAEQTAFEDHLESCDKCRQCLDEMAAEGSWWNEARGFLTATGTVSRVSSVDRPTGDDDTVEGAGSLFGLRGYLGPTDDPHMLGRLGGYEIIGVIGSGGMGVVLKAFDAPLNRFVAIKALAPQLAVGGAARQRFAREARAAAAVVHDNVMAIHAVSEANGLPFLVMPYVRGPSLEKRLRRTGPLSVVEILRIGMQIASGLAAAHAQGLVHRDIKPANILMEEGVDRVWITDFGLARAIDDATLTRSGVIAGTPQYMSPEQAAGEQIDHRSDLFSLGSVLYALCTGRPPFRASTILAVLRRVEEDRPWPIREINPEIPEWLARIVEKLQAKDPAQRFQSASEVATLLEGCLAHLRQPITVAAPIVPPSPTESRFELSRHRITAAAEKWIRRGLWLPLAVLICGLGMSAFTFLLATPPSPPTVVPEFYQDFRGGGDIPAPFRLFAASQAVIKRENEGLRIALPLTRKNNDVAGVIMSCRFPGDFEVTTRYEILEAGRPQAGHGIGFELLITTDTPKSPALGFSRLTRVTEGDVYWASQMTADSEGKPQFEQKSLPTTARSGQLRLIRIGEIASLQVAEGDSNEFRKLFEFYPGTEDLKSVRLAASPGWAPNDVAVRVQDLRIRSLNDPEAVLADPGAGARQQSRRWLGATLVFSSTAMLVALACLFVLRQRRFREEGEVKPSAKTPARFVWPTIATGLGVLAVVGYVIYPSAPPAAIEFTRTRALGWGWLATTEFVGMLVTLSFVGTWAFVSRRRMAVPTGADEPFVAQTLIQFSCSSCRKRFQVKAEWAGKKGKCLQCGQALIVPTSPRDRSVATPGANTARSPRQLAFAALAFLAVIGLGLVIFASQPYSGSRDSDEPNRSLRGHTGPIHNLNFLPDGRLVSVSGWPQGDRTLRIWDPASGRELGSMMTPAEIHSLALSADGSLALVGQNDGSVLVVDLERLQILKTCKGHTAAVDWVSFGPDTKVAYSASTDGTARAWNLDAAVETATFRVENKWARGGAVFPDGKRLLTGDSGGLLQLWDTSTLLEIKSMPLAGPWMIDSLSLTPDARQALVCGAAGVRVIDLETGREVRFFQAEHEEVYQATLSPDGQRLLTASFDGAIRLWNFQTGELLDTPSSHRGLAFAVAFSPDGRLAASGGGGERIDGQFVAGSDHEIRLLDLSSNVAAPQKSSRNAWLGTAFGVAALLAVVSALRRRSKSEPSRTSVAARTS